MKYFYVPFDLVEFWFFLINRTMPASVSKRLGALRSASPTLRATGLFMVSGCPKGT
jgi:hypothetical protein